MSQPQPQPQPKLRIPTTTDTAPPKVMVTFHGSVPLGRHEALSASTARDCDLVLPARINEAGAALPVTQGQASDGLIISCRGAHTFVPWANVKAISYVDG